MEAQLKALLEEQLEIQNQRISELRVEQHQMFDKMMALLRKERASEVNSDGSNFDPTFSGNTFKFLPRLEFPVFDESNPRVWTKKCSRYFCSCKISASQRVDLASSHLKGKAEMWFSSYIAVKKHVDWDEFIIDVCGRFKKDLGSRVVEDFNKLQQTGSLDEYLERFEELKALMIQRTPALPDVFFVDSFISGLKPQLKPFVKVLNPDSLQAAITVARLHEEALDAWKGPYKPPSSFHKSPLLSTLPTSPPRQSPIATAASSSSSVAKPSHQNFRTTRFISAAERAEKSAKGLCYFCDQPYERGHKCATKSTQLFLVEIPGGSSEAEDGEEGVEREGEPVGFEMLEIEPCISLQAVNGVQGYQTMRLTGHY